MDSQCQSLYEGISKKLKSGKDRADVILLDFAKAFDKVPFSKAFAEIELLRHTGQHPSMDLIFFTSKNTTRPCRGEHIRET